MVGSTTYIADDVGGLVIVDVSNPSKPQRVGGYDTKGHVQRVQVADRYAYITDGEWLLMLDVSDPTNPFREGAYQVAGGVQALRVVGQTPYLVDGTGQLRLLNVSDPANVCLNGTYSTFGTQGIAVRGNYAYLAKGSRGLEVVDVSNPTNMLWVTGATTAGPAQDVTVMGKYVLVAAGEGGLMVFEFQQYIYPPLKPPVIGSGKMTFTWPTLGGVHLQQTLSLAPPDWRDVPGTDLTNVVSLPMTNAGAFFRLVQGSTVVISDRLVWISPGNFLMGSPASDSDAWPWEGTADGSDPYSRLLDREVPGDAGGI